MAIGKREQIVVLSVAALATIALIHFFIFKKRSEDYAGTLQDYQQGVEKLRTAEVISDPQQLASFNEKTTQYEAQVTSVVDSLKLEVPDWQTSPPVGRVDIWGAETLRLLKQLVDLRAIERPRLTFLDERKILNPLYAAYAAYPAYATNPQYQVNAGWNLPPALASTGPAGALWDKVQTLAQRWDLMVESPNLTNKLEHRAYYNVLLTELGIPPSEVSNYFGYTYFNDDAMLLQYNTVYTGQNQAGVNPYSLARMGPAVAFLKKLWMYNLLSQQLDPRSAVTLEKLATVLEMGMPLGDGTEINTVNKQLASLIDIIKLAQQNQIQEISQVNLLRPTDFAKVEPRQPGVVPTPAGTPVGATPTPAYGGMGAAMLGGGGYANPLSTPVYTPIPADQKIGTGTGLEIYFTGTNPNIVKFLFDMGAIARTYSVDDLSIKASAAGQLTTSATVELVTRLDKLTTAGAAAVAAAPAAVGVPL